MPEYAILRLLLGVLQVIIAVTVLRRKIGYLFWFAIFMGFSGGFNVAPAFPHSEAYKQGVQIPCFIVSGALMASATKEIFSFLPRYTFAEERRGLLAFGLTIGLIPVATGWYWDARTWYQVVMTLRQYGFIALAVGYTASWCYLRWFHPVPILRWTVRNGNLWAVWLASMALLSTSGKGGLVWRMMEWHGGQDGWRIFCDSVLFSQMVLLTGFWINLRQWRGAPPSDLDEHRFHRLLLRYCQVYQ